MRSGKAAGIFRRVNFPRLSLLAAALLLTGCQTYTKLRVTNYRGDLVADWVAEGHVSKRGPVYKIKAVERTSPPPYSQTTHYPNGWQTTVAGPNIVRWNCGKPFWLYQLDGY